MVIFHSYVCLPDGNEHDQQNHMQAVWIACLNEHDTFSTIDRPKTDIDDWSSFIHQNQQILVDHYMGVAYNGGTPTIAGECHRKIPSLQWSTGATGGTGGSGSSNFQIFTVCERWFRRNIGAPKYMCTKNMNEDGHNYGWFHSWFHLYKNCDVPELCWFTGVTPLWVGVRQNRHESMEFPVQYRGVSCKMSSN